MAPLAGIRHRAGHDDEGADAAHRDRRGARAPRSVMDLVGDR